MERKIIDLIMQILYDNHYTTIIVNDDDYYFDFRIKECKGWLFGIRPHCDDTKATFFCQYEKEINKFKPSHSEYLCEIEPNQNPEWDIVFGEDEMLKLINFVHKHPVRAWNRDVWGIDYNIEYHTSVTLLWYYIKRQIQLMLKKQFNWIYKKYMIKFVKHKIILYLSEYGLENISIYDNGEYTYPRYDITCTKGSTGMESGYYGLFDDDIDSQKIELQWDAIENRFNKIAKIFSIYLDRPIEKNFVVVK